MYIPCNYILIISFLLQLAEDVFKLLLLFSLHETLVIIRQNLISFVSMVSCMCNINITYYNCYIFFNTNNKLSWLMINDSRSNSNVTSF